VDVEPNAIANDIAPEQNRERHQDEAVMPSHERRRFTPTDAAYRGDDGGR